MEKIKKYNKWIFMFLFAFALIVVYKSVDNLDKLWDWFASVFKIIKPFIVGFIIAYVLNIPRKRIDSQLSKVKWKFIAKKSRGISIVAVYAIAILIVFIVVRALIPAVYKNVYNIVMNADTYIKTVVDGIEYWQTTLDINVINLEGKAPFSKILEEFITSIDINKFSAYAKGVINITSGVVNVIISIIVSIYMLIDADRIVGKMKYVLSIFTTKDKTDKIFSYFTKVNNIFSKYIYCRVIDSILMCVVTTIVLSIIGVEYALLLGLLIGFGNLIPYFGAMIGAVVTIMVTLITGGIYQAIWTGISLFVLEQIDGNYIGPKIMGEVLEVRPLWVIFAVTVGGGLFGIVGMLLSVPVMVVIKMLVSDYLEIKRTKKAEMASKKV